MRTHTRRPWNATRAATGSTRSSATATDAAAGVLRRNRRRAAPTPGRPPSHPRATAAFPDSDATSSAPNVVVNVYLPGGSRTAFAGGSPA
jgi:hypothetical protein